MSRENYNYNPISAKNLRKAEPVLYEGTVYKSHCALANHLGIKSQRIGEALRSGKELSRVGGFVDEPFN